jgi:glycosyl transferase family 2
VWLSRHSRWALKPPIASVVLSSYNYGHLIEDAIESVRGQDFPSDELEIIVVDDGSTDDTPRRLLRYESAVRYIRKDNGGQASALNVGIRAARGTVVSLLDADDIWYRDKLRRVIREFEDPAVDVVNHHMDVVDAGGRRLGRLPDPHTQGPMPFDPRPLRSYLGGRLPFFPPTSGMSIRASCLRRIGSIPEEFRICADLYLLAILPFYAHEFRLVELPLAEYRIHGQNHWSGPAGAPRPDAMIRVLRLACSHVERVARDLGHDPRHLTRTFRAMEAEQTIALYRLQGRRLAALWAACRLDDPRLDGDRLSKLRRRASKVLSVIMPETHARLRERYRRSRVGQ